MSVTQYDNSHHSLWDEFVRSSKNGTFLFFRNYMDYHRDRLEDASLLFWNDEGKLVAVFPANRCGCEIISHQGLTYGGIIVDGQMKTPALVHLFDELLSAAQARSFTKLVYKSVPHIYHRYPAEEDMYALSLCNARLVRRSLMTVVAQGSRLPYQDRRRRGRQKAIRLGYDIRQCSRFDTFWKILADNLQATHGSRPVHSLEEIEYLHNAFPEHIKLYGCYDQAEMVAGVVIFETDRVARSQYIAASEAGKAHGALDYLFTELLDNVYVHHPYFDFGSSNTSDGIFLNRGLVDQKEGFGGRTVVQDHYEIDLRMWRSGSLLDAIR